MRDVCTMTTSAATFASVMTVTRETERTAERQVMEQETVCGFQWLEQGQEKVVFNSRYMNDVMFCQLGLY